MTGHHRVKIFALPNEDLLDPMGLELPSGWKPISSFIIAGSPLVVFIVARMWERDAENDNDS